VTAAAGLYDLAMGVGFEAGKILDGAQDYRAAIAAVATIGSAARLVLLAVEGDAAVAAASCANDEAGFIYELQRG
jgi:hypothetical protein